MGAENDSFWLRTVSFAFIPCIPIKDVEKTDVPGNVGDESTILVPGSAAQNRLSRKEN